MHHRTDLYQACNGTQLYTNYCITIKGKFGTIFTHHTINAVAGQSEDKAAFVGLMPTRVGFKTTTGFRALNPILMKTLKFLNENEVILNNFTQAVLLITNHICA